RVLKPTPSSTTDAVAYPSAESTQPETIPPWTVPPLLSAHSAGVAVMTISPSSADVARRPSVYAAGDRGRSPAIIACSAGRPALAVLWPPSAGGSGQVYVRVLVSGSTVSEGASVFTRSNLPAVAAGPVPGPLRWAAWSCFTRGSSASPAPCSRCRAWTSRCAG